MESPLNPPDPDKLLAEMAEEGRAPVGAYGQPVGGAYAKMRERVVGEAAEGGPRTSAGIARVRYTHEDCVDRILAAPGISQNELAAMYGVTASWMSIVINSDAFKVKLAERKAELVDPMLQATLNERFGALAARSVEVLLEKLHKPADQISDKLALEAAALGAKVVLPSEGQGSSGNAVDHLAGIAHRLLDLRKSVYIDGQARVIEGD